MLVQQRAEVAKLVREIVTPEGVPIRFQLARAGDRAGAFLLDMVIQIVVLIAVGWALSLAAGAHLEGSWLTAVVVVLAFLLVNFYFAFFEVRWQGTTPGKRKVGIRVIDARGGQLETSAVLARNLVRELEVWMPLRLLLAGKVVWPAAPGWAVLVAGAWTFVFMLFPLFNKDRLRIGDLIAGTRVVMQPKVMMPPDLVAEHAEVAVHRPQVRAFTFTEKQLAVYGVYELQILEGVLRQTPDNAGYFEAIRTVSDKIRTKIRHEGHIPEHDHDRFLRDFYAALRAHLEQKMLFGKRREDKFSK
ncbi:MAG: RDD family protein [Deltaproteobacteria bacterium]|nr:RDD family protein [Deltaproteobacteria bacterium]MDQ3295456.1 RDD family protein [Myxococcota bacterium]